MNRPLLTTLVTLSACSLDVKTSHDDASSDECADIRQEVERLFEECGNGDDQACADVEELSLEQEEVCAEGEDTEGFEENEDETDAEREDEDEDEDTSMEDETWEEEENDDSPEDSGGGTNPSGTNDGAPTIAWNKGQGTDREEHVHEGHQVSDGGYIAIGHNAESGANTSDILIVKVDSFGDLEWQTIIGQAGQWDVGIAIQEVSDGYIAAGGLAVDGTQKPALIKLNFQGDVVWEKTYGGANVGMIRGLDRMTNGNIAATGFKNYTESGFVFIADEGEGFLMEVDPDGVVQWEQTLSIMQGTKVRQTPDGGFAVLSNSWNEQDELNAAIVKTDGQGGVEWGGAEESGFALCILIYSATPRGELNRG